MCIEAFAKTRSSRHKEAVTESKRSEPPHVGCYEFGVFLRPGEVKTNSPQS